MWYGKYWIKILSFNIIRLSNRLDNIISFDDKTSEEFLERYPNCNERRKREYRKGIRYDGFYVNPDSDDVFYDDFDY